MPTVVFNEGRFNGGHYLNKAEYNQQAISEHLPELALYISP